MTSFNVKDCLIADRENNDKISVPVVFTNDGMPDATTSYFLPGLIAVAFLSLFINFNKKPATVRQRWRMAGPMPRYLLVRHLQV